MGTAKPLDGGNFTIRLRSGYGHIPDIAQDSPSTATVNRPDAAISVQ
jgi:hypothetical protein